MQKLHPSFTALTWNIHGGVGMDGRFDMERTGKVIHKLFPDIVALQEVDLRRTSASQPDPYSYLCKQAGEYILDAWAVDDTEGKYGQILASRYPIVNSHVHDISWPGREPRKVMEAYLELPSRLLRVIATHLGFWPGEKQYQTKRLAEIVMADSDTPLLLLGDLNHWFVNKSRNGFYSLFDDLTRHRSYPSFMPALALDRILSRRGPVLIESRAVREAYLVSDHLPVIATVSID